MIEPSEFFEKLGIDYSYYSGEFTVKSNSLGEDLIWGGIEGAAGTIITSDPRVGFAIGVLSAVISRIDFKEPGIYRTEVYIVDNDQVNMQVAQVYKLEYVDGKEVWVDYQTIIV